MEAMTEFLQTKLKLKVNADKSAVGRPWKFTFLGYSMTAQKEPKLRVAKTSRKRFKAKVKKTFREGRGQSVSRTIQNLNPILRGWVNYFRLTETMGALEDLDSWLRRKIPTLLWRQWKCRPARIRNRVKQGLSMVRAKASGTNGQGPWWNGGASHMNHAYPKSWFDRQGLLTLVDTHRRLQPSLGTAGCGTARPVVWEDGGGQPRLLPDSTTLIATQGLGVG